MRFSATFSRSSVVAPGFTWLRTSSSTSRTTRPARRIFSISSDDLSTTPLEPTFTVQFTGQQVESASTGNVTEHTNSPFRCCRFTHTRRRRAALSLTAQPLDGSNNSGRNRGDRPVSIHFGKTSQRPVVLDHRRGQCLVSAHALRKDLLRVIGSLDQRSAFYITKSSPLGGLQ